MRDLRLELDLNGAGMADGLRKLADSIDVGRAIPVDHRASVTAENEDRALDDLDYGRSRVRIRTQHTIELRVTYMVCDEYLSTDPDVVASAYRRRREENDRRMADANYEDWRARRGS